MRSDRWLIVIFLAGALLYAAWAAFVVMTNRTVDFNVYAIGATALAQGTDIYHAPRSVYDAFARQLGITNYEGAFQYPLFMALVIRLLLFLPYRLTAFLWIFGSGIVMLISAWLLGERLPEGWKRRLMLAAAIVFVPTLTTMNAGQVNAYILLFTVIALLRLHGRQQTHAGLVLALALWLKPLAAPLIALWVWRGRWQALSGMVLGSLGILAVTSILYGPSLAAAQLSGSGGFLAMLGFAHPANDNLNGLFSRWFTAHEFGGPLILAPALAVAGYLCAVGAVLFIDLRMLWPPTSESAPLLLEAALVVVTTHLVVPLTWYHHLTMTFLAFAVLIDTWADWRKPTPSMLIWILAFVMLAVHGLFWHNFVGQTLFLDLATWAELLLWGLLVVEIRRHRAGGKPGLSTA